MITRIYYLGPIPSRSLYARHSFRQNFHDFNIFEMLPIESVTTKDNCWYVYLSAAESLTLKTLARQATFCFCCLGACFAGYPQPGCQSNQRTIESVCFTDSLFAYPQVSLEGYNHYHPGEFLTFSSLNQELFLPHFFKNLCS